MDPLTQLSPRRHHRFAPLSSLSSGFLSLPHLSTLSIPTSLLKRVFTLTFYSPSQRSYICDICGNHRFTIIKSRLKYVYSRLSPLSNTFDEHFDTSPTSSRVPLNYYKISYIKNRNKTNFLTFIISNYYTNHQPYLIIFQYKLI